MSLEEIRAQITDLRDRVLAASAEADSIIARFDTDFMPTVNTTFAGSESPAALASIAALRTAYEAAFGFSATLFAAADELQTYVDGM
ncbi:hypothetical protein ACVDFE_02025 [Lentzea chajnantorensis]